MTGSEDGIINQTHRDLQTPSGLRRSLLFKESQKDQYDLNWTLTSHNTGLMLWRFRNVKLTCTMRDLTVTKRSEPDEDKLAESSWLRE